MDVISYIYYLKEAGFSLWVEQNKLKYIQYKPIENTEVIFNTLKQYRDQICRVLEHNQCSSEQIFLSQTIFRTLCDRPPLSFAQERLYFIDQYTEGNSAYNICEVFKVKGGKLNQKAFEDSLKEIIKRHEILRTLIKKDEEGKLYQMVSQEIEKAAAVRCVEVSAQEDLDEFLRKEMHFVFDITSDFPMRVLVCRLGKKETYISFVIHHIAFDGWSVDLFLKELNAFYSAHIKTEELKLPQLSVQYRDFAGWQRHYLTPARLLEQLEYWKNSLIGYENLNLITDKPRRRQFSYQGRNLHFLIDSDLSFGLRELAKNLRVSLYTVLLSAFYLMLRAYSNQDHFVIGTPVSNRHYSQIEDLLGFFVNALPLKINVDPDSSWTQFIQTIHQVIIEAQSFQDLPFEKLVEELHLPTDPGRHPVFQVMFGTQSFGLGDLSPFFENYESAAELSQTAKFDLSLFLDDSSERLKGAFNYATDLYEASTISQFLKTYQEILSQFVTLHRSKKAARLSDIAYLNPQEYEEIVHLWNCNSSDYPHDKTIHELFESQVSEVPNHTALICREKKISYQELNEKANRLARYLRDQGLGLSRCAVVCMERSERQLVVILAILKAGGAYVPVDPDYPDQRLFHILNETEANVVITDRVEKISGIYSDRPCSFINVEKIEELVDGYPSHNLSLESYKASPHQLAYVIYTSGTTGKPKGVMVEHRSFIAAIHALRSRYFSKADRINTYSLTSVVFDIFGLEYGIPLMTGGSVTMGLEPILSRLDCRNFHFIQMTSSLCDTNLDQLENVEQMKLLVGGEELSGKLLNRIRNKKIDCIHVYGPTETTIWSTSMFYPFSQDPMNRPQEIKVRIGTPLDNEAVYVLDKNLNPLPLLALGELYIGGAGVARGYLNDPELTREKFLLNPFQTKEEKQHQINERLYKTGDLARWMPEGALEFIGRADHQIKLRGLRIELGEIERAINLIAGIRQSIVILKKDIQGEYLASYYQTEEGEPIPEDKIKSFISAILPAFMIPSAYLHLERFPLTPTGKIDRNKLPEPNLKNEHEEFEDAQTPLEIQVRGIWSSILGLEEDEIDRRADFFRLGGNSILGIKLINKINSEINADLRIKDLFISSSLLEMCRLIQRSQGSFIYRDYLIKGIDKNHLFDPFPLSNVQQAYYMGNSRDLELGNTSAHVYVEYKFKDLDVARLRNAFNKLIDRHPALRTVFINGNQKFLEKTNPYVVRENFFPTEEEFLEFRRAISHKIYDPEKYPLFDLFVSKVQGGCILHISFDVLLMDAESVRILFNEWTQYYLSPELNLEDIDLTYRDYLVQYQALRKSSRFEECKKYWEDKIPLFDFEMNLPITQDPARISHPRFNRLSKIIERSVWDKVKDKCRQLSLSPTALIIEIFGKVLSRWTGKSRLCINLTLFNRLPLHRQIDQVVGDFTSLLLYNYSDDRAHPFKKKLEETQNALLMDMEHILFDGIDFQRLVRSKCAFEGNRILAPVVLTSVLGRSESLDMTPFLDNSFQGEIYSISQTPQVWLDNKAYETDEGFVAEWDYLEELIDQEAIEAMHAAYCQLIEALAESDWEEIRDLKIELPEADLQVIEYCNKETMPLGEETLLSLCENFILKESLEDNEAVYDDAWQQSFSYRELLRDSGLLAQAIRESFSNFQEGKNLSKPIAILACKGYGQVVSILSTFKSGNFYLPLNSEWPIGRIEDILNQAQVSTLLLSSCFSHLGDSLHGPYRKLIIEDELQKRRNDEIALLSFSRPKPDDLAYVIFTSGSTGKPKGVSITHQSAVNTIKAVNERFNLSSSDAVLALSDLSFDLSVFDIFGLLAVGGKIVMPDQNKLHDPHYWVELINTHPISIWNTVPQLAGLLADELAYSSTTSHSIRLFLLSGDWIPGSLSKAIKIHYPNSLVVSLGGATEGSIWSVWHLVNPDENVEQKVPYGRAMPNQKMWILNDHHEWAPINVSGEIYIGGVGVASNYFNNAEITNSSFIHHPVFGKIYKTGDFGKWNKKGYIDFLGRKDTQIKINGYRLELGEISAQLRKLPGVKDAIVKVFKEKNQAQLLGYLIAECDSHKHLFDGDRETFLLEEKGIKKEAIVDFPLDLQLDENSFRMRKSYRSFGQCENFISSQKILDLCYSIADEMQIIPLSKKSSSEKKVMETEEAVKMLLSEISGLLLKDKVLPKYKYPSAGSTYSVRCYVNFPENLQMASENISKGAYHYHPTHHSLSRIGHFEEDFPSVLTFNFVVHWPAIEPLYGKLSNKLSHLETGHMIGLMIDILKNQGISCELRVIDQEIDDSNTLIAKLLVNTVRAKIHFENLDFKLFQKNPSGNSYVSEEGAFEYSLKDRSLFEQATENQTLLENGEFLLCLEGEQGPKNWILSGALFQKLSDCFCDLNIGSCMLGLQLSDQTLYAMVLGSIHESEKKKADSHLPFSSLKELVDRHLSHVLPEYMLPDDYLVLERFPLTVNGKLDLLQLPKPVLESRIKFTQPRTAFEKEIAKIWCEVLGIAMENFGIEDDFFKLGGDSVSCIQLMGRLRQKLGLEVGIKDLFIYNTIQKLTDYLKEGSQELIDPIFSEWEGKCSFLANSLQQGFVYHYLIHGTQTDSYCIQSVWHYHSPIVVEHLKEAWKIVLETFGALRIRFSWDAEIMQVIEDELELDWRFLDISQANNEERRQFIQQLKVQDKSEHFQFDKGPLFRVYLIRQADDCHTCLFTSHHAILDGWSQTLLLKFLHETYLDLCQSKSIQVSRNYSYEMSQKFLQEHKGEDSSFWQNYVDQIEEKGTLISLFREDKNSLAEKVVQASEKEEEKIAGVFYEELKRSLRMSGITLNTLLQFCWHRCLHVFTRSLQTVVGTVVTMRNLPVKGIENSVGLHINTLPFFVDHEGLRKKTLFQVLQKVQADLSDISSRCCVNLSDIQKNGDRLFDSLFVFANYPSYAGPQEKNNLQMSFEEVFIKEDYSLVFTAYEEMEELLLMIKFDPQRISRSLMTSLMSSLVELLMQVPRKMKDPIDELTLLSNDDFLKIVGGWNKTQKEFDSTKTIHELFEEQVEKTPNNIAIAYEEKQLTYRELNEKANRLAHYLRSKGVGPDILVPIACERSLEMSVGIMAILKAGGAYVPLDLSFPIKRLEYILEDANAPVWLMQSQLIRQMPEISGITIDLDRLDELGGDYPVANPQHSSGPHHAAYVIYTSGSTGAPKGVVSLHLGCVNRLLWMKDYCAISPTDRILQKTSYAFDVSVWELLLPLIGGARVVFAKPDGHKDPKYLVEMINKHGITVIHFVPSMLQGFISQGAFTVPSLKIIISSGEALSMDLAHQCREKLPFTELHNFYGPTEASIDVSFYKCSNVDDSNRKQGLSMPIGKPIWNISLYILDRELHPVPVGVVGELYIGGLGLARGYLNRPELTKERFINNPFATPEERLQNRNMRLYRTGDLCRYLKDGNIEYIGRIDHQVKIHGFRIELGEIEAALLSHPSIQEAAVLACEDDLGNKRLAAYYSFSAEAGDLSEYLKSKLPDYMIPSFLIPLQTMQLTVNGKLDRQALPTPQIYADARYIPPSTEEEMKVCGIWAEVLGIDKQIIGKRDHFFKLGGNSILAIKLIHLINQRLELDINLAFLLHHPVLEDFIDNLNIQHFQSSAVEDKYEF